MSTIEKLRELHAKTTGTMYGNVLIRNSFECEDLQKLNDAVYTALPLLLAVAEAAKGAYHDNDCNLNWNPPTACNCSHEKLTEALADLERLTV